jgi:nucleoside-diphosphate-sugar epimerase
MAVSRALAAAAQGTPFPLYGDGTQRREFTYVGDVVSATLAAAQADARSAVVNVGGGESASMLEVLRIVEEVTQRPIQIESCGPQPGDVETTGADLTLARSLLDYCPRTSLRDGIAAQAAGLAGRNAAVRVNF